MTSRSSGFKFIDRAFKETLLLIPGWAADCRIFNTLDLDFNYLLTDKISASAFDKPLLESLEKYNLDKISILGWSMGGFLAAEFASRYPQHVRDLTLVGMRRRYDKDGIGKIKEYIASNKNGYLYQFYHECFSSKEKEALSTFKKGLMRDYLKELPTDELLAGLDYLKAAELKADMFKEVKTRFIHGKDDRIAPMDEALALERGLSGQEFVFLDGAGHIPFLRSDFKEAFYGK